MARADGEVTEDPAGEEVIDIDGAVKYGWQLQEVTR
jgi:hypothetical protein